MKTSDITGTRRKWRIWSIIIAAVWQVIFAVEATVFHGIIMIHPKPYVFYHMTLEYWTWYVQNYKQRPYEYDVIVQSNVLGWLFGIAMGICIVYHCFSGWEKKAAGRAVIIGALIWLLLSGASYCAISALITHYRLFMPWVPVEFLSVWLIVLLAKKPAPVSDCDAVL